MSWPPVLLCDCITVLPGDDGRHYPIIGQPSPSPPFMRRRFELSLFIRDYSDRLLVTAYLSITGNTRIDLGRFTSIVAIVDRPSPDSYGHAAVYFE
jgi:hypothetical protein